MDRPSVRDGCQCAGNDEWKRAAKSGLLDGKVNNVPLLPYRTSRHAIIFCNAGKLEIQNSS